MSPHTFMTTCIKSICLYYAVKYWLVASVSVFEIGSWWIHNPYKTLAATDSHPHLPLLADGYYPQNLPVLLQTAERTFSSAPLTPPEPLSWPCSSDSGRQCHAVWNPLTPLPPLLWTCLQEASNTICSAQPFSCNSWHIFLFPVCPSLCVSFGWKVGGRARTKRHI